MTWVVGTNSLFGKAFLVSDIRISFLNSDGVEVTMDCLQKVHPLGPYIAGGFAGSVYCGLHILKGLSEIMVKIPEGHAWDLEEIANSWLPGDIKRLFEECPEEERVNGSAIMLAGADPVTDRGIPGMSLTHVNTFICPNFECVKAEETKTVSIGSGNDVLIFMNAIATIAGDTAFHQMATGTKNGQARFLAHIISETVRKAPDAYVAPYFQVTSVERGQIQVIDHEYTEYPGSGKPPIEHKFPVMIRSYNEFLNWCSAMKVATASCFTGTIAKK